MSAVDLIDVIEHAYRVEQSPAAWLADARDAVGRALGDGEVCAYFVDCSNGGFRRWGERWGAGSPAEMAALSREYDDHVDLASRRAIHMFAPAGSNDALPAPDPDADETWIARTTARWSVLGINAIDASLRGCCFSRWRLRASATPPTAQELEVWSRLSAHLASGARLVHTLEGIAALDRAEAVLTPSGKVLEASGAARSTMAREAIREAARVHDRARTRQGRARSRDAIASWRAMVEGRWTVIDHFDHDGRRFVVAQPNEPPAEHRRALSPRERQVALAASLGHTNKLIAYELGLEPSTVSVLLARSRRKLGARTRLELIEKLALPENA